MYTRSGHGYGLRERAFFHCIWATIGVSSLRFPHTAYFLRLLVKVSGQDLSSAKHLFISIHPLSTGLSIA